MKKKKERKKKEKGKGKRKRKRIDKDFGKIRITKVKETRK